MTIAVLLKNLPDRCPKERDADFYSTVLRRWAFANGSFAFKAQAKK
jgi:hypothetical protein